MIALQDLRERRWLWLLLLLPLGIGWWLWAGWSIRPERAVPSQTALLVDLQGYANARQLVLQSDTTLVGGFLQSAIWTSLWSDVDQLLRWSRNTPELMRKIAGNRMLAGFSLLENDSLHPVFIVQMQESPDLEAWLNALPSNLRHRPSLFQGNTIYTLQATSGQSMVVGAYGNLLLFSRFSYLVEEAILQASQRSSWWSKHAFQESGETNAPIRFGINPEMFAGHLSPYLEPAWRNKLPPGRFGLDWLGFRWDGQKVTLQLKAGYLPGMDHFEGLDALSRVVPDNPTFVAAMNHSGNLWMLYAGEKDVYENYIASWAGHEIAFVAGEPLGASMQASGCWLLAVRDARSAEKSIERYGKAFGLVREYDYQTFHIRQFLHPGLLGGLAGASQNPAAVIIDGFLIVAPSPSVLETWIDKYVVSQTLANRPAWLLLKERMPEATHGFILLNAGNTSVTARELLPYAVQQRRAPDLKLLRKAGFIMFPLQQSKSGNWSSPVLSQPLHASEETASMLWKTELAARATSAPVVFLQPAPGGGLDILIQDVSHQLYCLDQEGKIRWRRQLDGPQRSTIFRLDFLKNGENHYLLNTEGSIYLLDPGGNDAPGYPVHLQSPASNGLVAVDFDGKGETNYFIGCQNGNLYGFDRHGRPLRGWNPVSIGSAVPFPLAHAHDAKNDYLVVCDGRAQLWAFGRYGERKFGPVALQGTPAGPPQIDRFKDRITIAVANTAGRLSFYHPTGAVYKNVQGISSPKTPARWAMVPPEASKRSAFVLLSGNRLVSWHYQGSQLRQQFSKQLDSPQDTLFALPDRYFGVLNKAQKRLALFSTDGRLLPGFPLAGSTACSLSPKEAAWGYHVLITGHENALFAYRIPD